MYGSAKTKRRRGRRRRGGRPHDSWLRVVLAGLVGDEASECVPMTPERGCRHGSLRRSTGMRPARWVSLEEDADTDGSVLGGHGEGVAEIETHGREQL